MADLTGDAPIKLLGETFSEMFILDTSIARRVYKGQCVFINQDVDSQNAAQFIDSVVVDTDDVILGIAAEGKTVRAGQPEDYLAQVEVYVWPSIVGFLSDVFNNADLGKTVYMSDSATLSETAADNPEIGKLHKVQDGYCYVELSGPMVLPDDCIA